MEDCIRWVCADLEVDQSCVGTWGNSASASTYGLTTVHLCLDVNHRVVTGVSDRPALLMNVRWPCVR